MIVNQWIQAAHAGDAIGNHALAVRDILRREGYQSDIFSLTIEDALEGNVLPWSQPDARQGDVTILHFALPSPMTGALATLPGMRVLCYHNVTPPSFFAPFSAGLAGLTAHGRRDVATLVGRVDLALGVSEYNRQELEEMGFEPTGVLPLVVDTDRFTRAEPVPPLERMLQDGLVNILFVGRIAPNKKIEDHIRLAEHYKRYVDAYYRFIFVGKYDAVPRYYDAVRGLIAEYRMLSDRFWFPGPASDAELGAYYRNAHAYVSLSEHEGFCAPLIEAMSLDVPVLAYGAAAVPETMGGAGVCFTPKDLEWAAELLGALVYDRPLRDRVIAGQRERVKDFSREVIEPQILDALAEAGV